MSLRCEPLSDDFGLILYGDGSESILDLDVEEVKELFKEQGVLLFRGFEVDPQVFRDFTIRFTRTFLTHYNIHRKMVGDDTQTVQLHREGIPLHGEMHYLPTLGPRLAPPDIIWFYCVSPAAAGGETILCDGVRLLSELNEPARALFLEKKLKYSFEHPAELWRGLVPDKAQVEQLFRQVEGITDWRFDQSDTLFWDYETSAIRKTRYTGQDAFINNLLCSRPPLSDGTPITKEIISAVLQDSARITVPLNWQKDDLVMIDNSRYMHGRWWHDEQRLIYVRMSLANF